jgi:DNA polymerase-3 subunit delta
MSDAHIHILFGSDEFGIANRAGEFLTSFSDPTTAEMNISRLDARAVGEDELNNATNAMPFLAAQRVVLLTAPSKRYTGADGHRKFTAFLDAVPSSTRLVILEQGEIREREKANHWLLKWARGAGARAEAQEFNLPRRRDMPGWIVNEARKQGSSIEPPAAARLAEMVGEDTRQAAMEIAKLLTYVNYAHPIGVEDVEAVSIVNAQGDVFALVDALGTGNGRLAQKMLHQLLAQAHQPLEEQLIARDLPNPLLR